MIEGKDQTPTAHLRRSAPWQVAQRLAVRTKWVDCNLLKLPDDTFLILAAKPSKILNRIPAQPNLVGRHRPRSRRNIPSVVNSPRAICSSPSRTRSISLGVRVSGSSWSQWMVVQRLGSLLVAQRIDQVMQLLFRGHAAHPTSLLPARPLPYSPAGVT